MALISKTKRDRLLPRIWRRLGGHLLKRSLKPLGPTGACLNLIFQLIRFLAVIEPIGTPSNASPPAQVTMRKLHFSTIRQRASTDFEDQSKISVGITPQTEVRDIQPEISPLRASHHCGSHFLALRTTPFSTKASTRASDFPFDNKGARDAVT